MNPEVSIVIPTFNRSDSIGRAVGSALCTPNSDVVVVDDGSTDDTQAVLSTFGDKIISLHQKNSGVASARNHGLRFASGRYLKFLDSDDAVVPGSLSRQLDEIKRLPINSAAVGELTTSSDQPSINVDFSSLQPINTRQMATQALQVSQPLFEVECVRKVGGFSNSAMAEDFDLFLRLHMAGTRFYATGTPVTVFDDSPAFDRLSRKDIGSRFAMAHAMYLKLAQQATKWDHPDAEVLHQGLGQHLWSLGRRLARENAVDEAHKCFSLARRLAGPKAFKARLPMKLMYRAFDPVTVERLFKSIKIRSA